MSKFKPGDYIKPNSNYNEDFWTEFIPSLYVDNKIEVLGKTLYIYRLTGVRKSDRRPITWTAGIYNTEHQFDKVAKFTLKRKERL